MILSQKDIRKLVKEKKICFSPELEEKQWGEASVDLRLGRQFTVYRKEIRGVTLSVAEGLGSLGDLNLWETEERDNFDLIPGEMVLALTHESITVPNNLIALVEGRSTYARVGLSMHQTAPWIQPGWSGPIVLEIANHGQIPIKLTPLIDRPCQLTFLQLKSPVPKSLAYGSRKTDTYKDQAHPLKHKRRG
jgi:dCTP deaminase